MCILSESFLLISIISWSRSDHDTFFTIPNPQIHPFILPFYLYTLWFSINCDPTQLRD